MSKSLSFCLALSFFTSILFAQAPSDKFLWYGKSGARAIMPENTLEGMLRAMDLGVDVLDLDVVISKDKEVILASDPFFSSAHILTPEGKPIPFAEQKKHNIYAMDYAQIRLYDVGSKVVSAYPGQEKFKAEAPRLSSVVEAVEQYAKSKNLKKPDFSIEFRMLENGDDQFHPKPKEYVDLVMQQIKAQKIEKRVILQAFDIRVLQYIKKTYPKMHLALLVDTKEEVEDHIKRLGFVPDIFSPYLVIVGKSLVDKCHELGMRVIPWTVNSSDKVIYFKSLGVDGIVTDYPNLRNLVESN